MNIEKIKQAVQGGLVVHWNNEGYTVKENNGQWLVCHENGSCVGLIEGGSQFYIGDHLEFSHTLCYRGDVGYMWCEQFLDDHDHIKIDDRNGLICLIIGDIDEPQWKISELRRMRVSELREIADRLNLGNCYWNPQKQDLINELEVITKGEFEKSLFDEQGFYNYDADFTLYGYSQGDAFRVKVLGDYPYITKEYLQNLYFDSPISGEISMTSTLGTVDYTVYEDELCYSFYEWDKDKVIENLEKHCPNKIGHDQLIQWAKDNLPEGLDYV